MVPDKVTIRSDCTLIDYFEVASGSVAVNEHKAAQDGGGILQISQSDNKDLRDPITIETYLTTIKTTGKRANQRPPSPKIASSAAVILEARAAVSLSRCPHLRKPKKLSPSPILGPAHHNHNSNVYFGGCIPQSLTEYCHMETFTRWLICLYRGLRKHGTMELSFLFSVISL
jgi:hypothetical protein